MKTLYVTSDAFRQRHPFIVPDGRRFASLITAAHSLICSGPKHGCIIEETKIGERTWDRRTISYEAARMAYDQDTRAAALRVL